MICDGKGMVFFLDDKQCVVPRLLAPLAYHAQCNGIVLASAGSAQRFFHLFSCQWTEFEKRHPCDDWNSRTGSTFFQQHLSCICFHVSFFWRNFEPICCFPLNFNKNLQHQLVFNNYTSLFWFWMPPQELCQWSLIWPFFMYLFAMG